MTKANPEIVFHLAAQALVKKSTDEPVNTFMTNVIGSARLYDACFHKSQPCTFISVTSDKVYKNDPNFLPYQETHELGGSDPYSASKAANEILIESWRKNLPRNARLFFVISALWKCNRWRGLV